LINGKKYTQLFGVSIISILLISVLARRERKHADLAITVFSNLKTNNYLCLLWISHHNRKCLTVIK